LLHFNRAGRLIAARGLQRLRGAIGLEHRYRYAVRFWDDIEA